MFFYHYFLSRRMQVGLGKIRPALCDKLLMKYDPRIKPICCEELKTSPVFAYKFSQPDLNMIG